MRKRPTMVSRVKDYLAHRRALGFALETTGELLMQFARFADKSGHRGPLTTDLALPIQHDNGIYADLAQVLRDPGAPSLHPTGTDGLRSVAAIHAA